MTRNLRPILFLLFILTSFLSWADDSGSTTLRLTADLEGYLIGCDCPSGASAGISALAEVLKIHHEGLLIDIGGFREPGRSDPLLEKYLDEAAVQLGYAALIATAADLRDSPSEIAERGKTVPFSVAGSAAAGGLFRKLPGEGSAMVLEGTRATVSIVEWISDPASAAGIYDGTPAASTAREAAGFLSASDADYRILVIRGAVGDWATIEPFLADSGILPDLVSFTGMNAPAYFRESGGTTGQLESGGSSVPWLALAPRGNGMALVNLQADNAAEIEIIRLQRGIDPDSTEILALGDTYMEDLVAGALAASGRSAATGNGDEAAGGSLQADYWYPYGCRDCEDFLWDTVPGIERESGMKISMAERNSSDPDDFDVLTGRLDELGIPLEAMPVMIIGDRVYQGEDVIREGLEATASGASGSSGQGSADTADSSPVRWEPGAVFLAGLLDGVNPCAFSAMVFLISALALAGRSKKTMLAIGLFYAAGVFVTYSLIGAGLLGGLRRIAVESGVRIILEYVLGGILVVLAVLSLVDGIRISRGRNDLLLKLPEKLSKRVHGIIRENVRSGAAAGGSFLLGAAVAVIELGCTGQVYLPTIAWMISREEGAAPWLWLLLYNAAFILPLLIVFVVSYRGVTAMRLAALFKRRGALVKYATALLFAVLAAVMVLTL